MNTIKLNNTTFEIDSYNRNTYFNNDSMGSTANCTLKHADMTALNALAAVEITTIQIYHDSELIYDLDDINAKITNINEYLNTDTMTVSLSLTFDLN